MKKRTFLKLSTALAASPVIAPLTGWAADDKLKNWAGNYTYSTNRLHPANSLEQVRNLVKKHDRLKVLGTRHCFNGIADSSHNLLSLRSLDQVIKLDSEARTVTVEAGMSYGQLCPILHEKGFALHNLASLPHTTIAGACVTATHGSGIKNGNLATAVSALEFVTAAGDVRVLTREKDGDTFRGAVVNLGALGVMTKVTLDLLPTFLVRQNVYENLPMAQLKDHFEAIMSGGYSVSLFTDWQRDNFSEVWVKSRVEPGVTPSVKSEFFGAKAATRNIHPIVELSAENCTAQMGVPGPWFDRLPHFRMGFTPSSGKELQSEYFVPRGQAVEAILAVERLHNQVGPHLMISEIRTIDADQFWMSPCYQRPSVAIHFTWKQDWPSVRKLLPVIEKELVPFGVRPHWGKLFTTSAAQFATLYERLPDFKNLVSQFDPKGKFRNEFLEKTIYGV